MLTATLSLPVTEISREADLLAVLAGLLPHATGISIAERLLLSRVETEAAPEFLASLKRQIRQGRDPLGEAYARVHSPEARRGAGVTLTPLPVVDQVVSLAADLLPKPHRVVDCGAGSGRFTIAALQRFRAARIVACEINPLLALVLRANVACSGLEARLEVFVGDFRELTLPRGGGPTLFIGNPPYVRHHDIPAFWKNWYQRGLQSYGAEGSQLAGLHLHFFLKAKLLAQAGDAGCFITAAEWLDVGYGAGLRQLLLNGLGGVAVHTFPPEQNVFPDALTTAAITSFQVGSEIDGMRFSTQGDRTQTRWISCATLQSTPNWSSLTRPQPARPKQATKTLGDYFKVQRGQVTGANNLWIVSPDHPELPESVMFPAVTQAEDLLNLNGGALRDPGKLKRVIDLPADLSILPLAQRRKVESFLVWAEKLGARNSYIASHRKPWWCVNLREPAPVIMTYMGRRPPVFARNLAGARLLNIAHGLYPLQPIAPRTLNALVDWLNKNTPLAAGRVYAGGLVKFEPGEAMRIPVPPLEHFSHVA